jgi:hypothetical protein
MRHANPFGSELAIPLCRLFLSDPAIFSRRNPLLSYLLSTLTMGKTESNFDKRKIQTTTARRQPSKITTRHKGGARPFSCPVIAGGRGGARTLTNGSSIPMRAAGTAGRPFVDFAGGISCEKGSPQEARQSLNFRKAPPPARGRDMAKQDRSVASAPGRSTIVD